MIIDGGVIADVIHTGVNMERGGMMTIKSIVINSPRAFEIDGFITNYGGGNIKNYTIGKFLVDSITFNGKEYIHMKTSDEHNHIIHHNVILNQQSNYIYSASDASKNIYGGFRIILGSSDHPNPTLQPTHGFPGDLFKYGGSTWKCLESGYSSPNGRDRAGKWILQ